MAGYSGQLVALDTDTPSELAQAAAQATAAQAQASVAQQTVPADVTLKREQAQGLGIQNASNQLTLQQQTQLNAIQQHRLAALDAAQQPQAQSTSPLSAVPPQSASTAPVSLFDPKIEAVIQGVNPDDPQAAEKFDAGMKAISNDVPEAEQFVGNYSRSAVQNWRSQIGSHAITATPPPSPTGATVSPLAAVGLGDQASVPNATSPLAPQTAPIVPVSPLTGKPDPDLARMAIINPEAAAKQIKLEANIRYQQTGDPQVLARYDPDMYKTLTEASKNMTAAQADAIKTQFSTMGQQANAVLALASKLGNDAPEVRGAYNAALATAVQNHWMTPQAAQQKESAPVDRAQLAFLAAQAQTVTEYMDTSGASAANKARAEAANPTPDQQYIGTDTNGRPIYHNLRAAPGTPDTVGNIPVNAKPSAGGSTFETKRNVWLVDHPGDTQGADEFANGQRQMAPGTADVAAAAAAARDAQTAALSGQPFDEAGARANYLKEFTTAGPAASGAPAATPTSSPAHGQMTPAQLAAAKPFAGAQAQMGSAGNPAIPRSEAQYNKLPKGAHYIYVDGSVRIKP